MSNPTQNTALAAAPITAFYWHDFLNSYVIESGGGLELVNFA